MDPLDHTPLTPLFQQPASDGCTPAGNDVFPERFVFLKSSGDWLSVYDEQLAEQGIDALDGYGIRLAKQFSAPVVLCWSQDCYSSAVALYDGSERRALYLSELGQTEQRTVTLEGVAAWHRAFSFTDSTSFESLFANEDEFQVLAQMDKLLGLNDAFFDDAKYLGGDMFGGKISGEFSCLAYTAGFLTTATEAPSLQFAQVHHHQPLGARVGLDVSAPGTFLLRWSLANQGRSARGLGVRLDMHGAGCEVEDVYAERHGHKITGRPSDGTYLFDELPLAPHVTVPEEKIERYRIELPGGAITQGERVANPPPTALLQHRYEARHFDIVARGTVNHEFTRGGLSVDFFPLEAPKRVLASEVSFRVGSSHGS